MNLSFSPESAYVQMDFRQGMTLSYSMKIKPGSATFSLKSGLELSECIFRLTIHPRSQSPYREKSEADGRLGEISPFMNVPSKKDNFYMMWLHIPDEQFNMLLSEASRQNLPSDIDIGVNDGFDDEKPDGLVEGVWNDVYASIRARGGNLPIRSFLFTVDLVKGPSAVQP